MSKIETRERSMTEMIECLEEILTKRLESNRRIIETCFKNIDFEIIREYYMLNTRKTSHATYRYHRATKREGKHTQARWFGSVGSPWPEFKLGKWRKARYISKLYQRVLEKVERNNHVISNFLEELHKFKRGFEKWVKEWKEKL